MPCDLIAQTVYRYKLVSGELIILIYKKINFTSGPSKNTSFIRPFWYFFNVIEHILPELI